MGNPLAAAAALQERQGNLSTVFDGARLSRLYDDWTTTLLSPDAEIQYSLRLLRARSRSLARNSSFITGFLLELENNVIGEEGIQLQARIKDAAGRERQEINQPIERAWKEWSHPEHASVDTIDSWIDLQRLIIRTMATDGEVFVRPWKGWDNRFAFAVQLIDADLLDETYDVPPDENGVEVRMGVEKDRFGKPLAYWFWDRHPASRWGRGERVRVPADEIIHLFIRYRANQSRGYPWFAPVLTDTKMLSGLLEAELVASRASSAQMGFIVNKASEAIEAYAAKLARAKKQGELKPRKYEAAPGVIAELLPGQEFQEFSPNHPPSAFESFTKVVLRSVARGVGSSYATLTGDLSDANYGSLRAGLLPERDHYRALQGFLARRCHRPVYRPWVGMALLSGAIDLPPGETRVPSAYYRVAWQGRGWQWIDPIKDLQAAEREIKLGLNSRRRLAGERGRDYHDLVLELAEEERLAREHGVHIGGVEKDARDRRRDEAAAEDDDRDARGTAPQRLAAARSSFDPRRNGRP